MAKKELIEKWESKEGVPPYEISAFPVNPSLNEMYIAGYGVARKEILDDLKQLDEPEKVIVPPIIDKFIRENEDPIYEICAWADYYCSDGRTCEDSQLSAVINWYGKNSNEFYQAVINGYEVETEQFYYVFDTTTKQYLGVDKVLNKTFWLSSQNSGARTPLTEQEIKAIDERYWSFAVKVDGE